jgi:hypothetical protein
MIAVVGFDGCVHAFMEVSEVNEETLKWPLTYLDELTWNQGTGVPTGAFDYSGQAEEEEEE